MPDTPLTTSTMSLLPTNTPTILSSAVATLLNSTPQSPMAVQAVQRLAVGVPPPAPPVHKSKLPWVLGGTGVLGLTLAAFLILRKKRRK